MTITKILATSLGVTLTLALIGLQSSVAQPGSGFENRGERYFGRGLQANRAEPDICVTDATAGNPDLYCPSSVASSGLKP
jgi:hypothetical protein